MRLNYRFLLTAVIATAVWLVFLKENSGRGDTRLSSVPAAATVKKVFEKSEAPAASEGRQPASNTSLKHMAGVMREFTRPENSLKKLVDQLREDLQEPIVSYNANDSTGEMAIVRTRNPLPGTRYFHAQYFGEGGEGFVQHMSFEFQPGPNAMGEVVASLKEAFALGDPSVQRDGYMKWEVDPGHNLWVQKLGPEELQNDPFNAYTAADDGTVRAVYESKVHGED